MHFALLLIGLAVYVTAQPTQPKIPKFPFLQGVSAIGKQEFETLFSIHDLTRAQWLANMMRWAEKYNVKKAFVEFKEKLEKDKEAAEADLLQSLAKLTQFFKEYQAIADDVKLTWDQANEKRQKLVKKLTPKQMEAAAALSEIFAPDDGSEPQKTQEQYVAGPYGPQEREQYGVGQLVTQPQGAYSPDGYLSDPYGQGPYGVRARREAQRFHRVEY